MDYISEKQPNGSEVDLEKKISRSSFSEQEGKGTLTEKQLQLEREMGLGDEEGGVKRGLKQR